MDAHLSRASYTLTNKFAERRRAVRALRGKCVTEREGRRVRPRPELTLRMHNVARFNPAAPFTY